jgi:hypothetical protein
MQSLTVISEIELDDEGVVLDYDLDGQGRLCTLVQTSDGDRVVTIGGDRRIIPHDWAAHVREIRWLGYNEVAVWPIAPFSSSPSYIGIVSLSAVSTIDSAHPLYVFADKNFLVVTFSEELTRIDVPSDQQSDLISVFSHDPDRKIGRFVEVFADRFAHERFMEVTCGVVDGEMGGFWFTAYSTDLLWYFSFKGPMTVQAGPLGCPASDVVAICCEGESATLLLRTGGRLTSRVYARKRDAVVFQSESVLSLPANLNDRLHELDVSRSGRIAGLRGNYLVILTSGRALLAGIQTSVGF